MHLTDLTLKQQQYVETIADLIRQSGDARTTDLAMRLSVSLPSVSQAVTRLSQLGIARRKSWHEIVLTPAGRVLSAQLDGRHTTLRHFMTDILAMDQRAADENACRLEHCVAPGLVTRLNQLAAFFERNPAIKAQWHKSSRVPARTRRASSQRKNRTG